MFDKVYSNDNNENLKIFDDIERRKNFSNYSIELNRLFGDKSYDIFHKNLIEHKKAKCSNFISMFQKPKNLRGMKIYEEPFNIALFEESLNNMKLKADKLSYKIKNPYKSRPLINSITKEKTEKLLKEIKKKKLEKKHKKSIKSKKEKIYLPDVPDVGRYNPSDDVLRKHTYQACFSMTNFQEFNKNCEQFNDRNLFYKINDLDYDNDSNYDNRKIKKIVINSNIFDNIPHSVDKKIKVKKDKNIKLKKNQKLYISTSPLFNINNMNINTMNKSKVSKTKINKNKINKEEKNEFNRSLSDSQILIRTNGDVNERCPKRVNNLFNTSSNFSCDDSKLNNSGFYSNSINQTNAIINLKNNHCLRFDNYSKRKPIINKLNYTAEHFINANAFELNYPIRNKNACLEFNKLSTGKTKQKCFFEVEANKNKNPPIGAYNPKFETTFGRVTTNIFLNKNNLPITKKKKLKKIIYNYNVPSNYLLFQSLNKKVK